MSTTKKTAAATTSAAAEKKSKVVVFKLADLEEMKRKRIVLLAKRAGLKANKNSAALVEDCKKDHASSSTSPRFRRSSRSSRPSPRPPRRGI